MAAPVRRDEPLRRDHAPERHPHPAADRGGDGRGDEPLSLSPSEARALRQQQMSGVDDDPAHARALRQAALRQPSERRHAAAATESAGAEDVQDLLLRCILEQDDEDLAPPRLAPIVPAEENVWIEPLVGLCAEWIRSVHLAQTKHSASEHHDEEEELEEILVWCRRKFSTPSQKRLDGERLSSSNQIQ
jgi:hypothetical protein